MNKNILLLSLVLIISSCKTKMGITEAKAAKELTAKKIIQSHYDNKKDFSTLYIRGNAKYKDTKQSLSFNVDIRIKKDEIILVSVRFLGITMAKGIITPNEVKYYEKNGGNYFEGDYSTLSNWLGTDLDFFKVQNMLLGNAFDDLKQGKYRSEIEEYYYKLTDENAKDSEKTFYFEAANFLIKKQAIEQVFKNRKLVVLYPNYKAFPEAILPLELVIHAIQNNENSTISIQYNQVTFNEDLSFPYQVPEGYDKIEIDQSK